MKRNTIARLSAAIVLTLSSLLSLASPVVHASGNLCSWTGTAGDNAFTNAANWANCGGSTPGAADTAVFTNTSLTQSATINIASAQSVSGLTFNGTSTSHSFTLSGSPITLSGGISDTTAAFTTINNNIVLTNVLPISTSGNALLDLGGVISGPVSVVYNGTSSDGLYLDAANTFTGAFTANGGSVYAGSATSLGNSTATFNDGSNLGIGTCADTGFTITNNFVFNGATSNPSGTYPTPKLLAGAGCKGGGGGADVTYGATNNNTGQAYVLSGSVTLGADTTVEPVAKTVTLTGALSGSHAFNVIGDFDGALVLNGSSNATTTPNGNYTIPHVTQTLTDSQPTQTVEIGSFAAITIDGARSDVSVDSGGILYGSGTVGNLYVTAGGTVAPGHSPGCLNATGGFILTGTYQFQIGGTTPCTGYDQISTNTTGPGSINLTGGTLDTELYNGFVPKVGDTYTLIVNHGAAPATGTLKDTNGVNLPEGAIFTNQGVTYKISYVTGAGGQNVSVTVTAVDPSKLPKAPNTGLALVSGHPMVSLATSVFAAAGIAFVANRMKPAKAHAKRR